MSVTIRDVAQKLNLSITTISRALDGYEDVSEDTRRLVIQTAQEMGYAPNQAARQLRRKRADSIGYILPADRPRFSDPFFAEFVAGLGDEASMHDLDLLVSSAPPDSLFEQRAYERWIHSHKVDGIILNRMRLYDWRVQYLARIDFPFATFERSLDAVAYPSVEVDGKRWFRTLIEHLAQRGYRRIAYIGTTSNLKIQFDRFSGYQEGIKQIGLDVDPELVVEGNLTTESGYHAALQMLRLENPPTAIACIDDLTAIGVLHAAREMGRTVGRDLAVVGYDGIEGFMHTQPPLTTVNQPVYQIARQLIRMLVKRIAGEPLSTERIYVAPVLEINQSSLGA
jgi:LacI family transcriptional regulator